MERYVCIHGHFYQPPRENPWLEAIEMQDSAFPYHDWNLRVADECYEPNSTSRILDDQNRIADVVNNYARISFNIGPTLLAWLESAAPEVYESILQADRDSQKLFSGHGSAMAQVYNHLIMPLANQRDRYTQVLWGIKDFEARFGRQPEGMWLTETAADLETLSILADLGIKFTILAPRQASQVHQIGAPDWDDVSGSRIDPTRAYDINLPSGRKLALFFYDGPISQAVAFEHLLDDGERFANRLMSGFSDQRQWPQLVHIATDGESYGHHHRHGDMALAYALHYLETNQSVKLTNYGEYLAKYPPTHEVRIFEKSSWSCVHGVDRWWRNCGCNSGGHPDWNQEWRTLLRQALDWLRDIVAAKYEKEALELFEDPWAARNGYISVILDRSKGKVDEFLSTQCRRKPGDRQIVRALKLLELQRHAMLMYTSCGWFFDELSGLETVQVIQYAGRVNQLSEELFGESIEEEFLKRLEAAQSNLPEYKNGRVIYEKFVLPTMIDLKKVSAHFAISSLFDEYSDPAKVYCYIVDIQDYRKSELGRAKLAVGRVEVRSEITLEKDLISFGVIHFGDQNLNSGVRTFRGEEAYAAMVSEMTRTAAAGEFAEVIRLMDKHFGVSNYSLKSLFRDEQRKVVNNILQTTLSEIEVEHRKIYQNNYPLMRFLSDLGNVTIPRAFQSSARLILNSDLRKELTVNPSNEEEINRLLTEVKLWKVGLATELGHVFRQTLEKKMFEFSGNPENTAILSQTLAMVTLAKSMPFGVELRCLQNIYYQMLGSTFPEIQAKMKKSSESNGDWTTQFLKLGEVLSMRTEQ